MSVEVSGIDKVKQMVSGYTRSIRTMRTLFEKIESEIEKEVENAIKTQKSATTGKKFKELSDITVEKTGKSKNQALYSDSGGTGRIVKLDKISDKDAVISVSMPFAEIQQFGNPDNKYYESDAPIPARQFLPITRNGKFTKKFENRLSEITQEWLKEKVNKRGI